MDKNEKDITGKDNTILRFIFFHNEKARLNEFFKEISLSKINMKFHFNEKDTKTYVDTSISNDIKFDVDLDENNIYYQENINLISNKSDIPNISFEYPIYKNKINNIYLDEENKKGNKSLSLEIIYQTSKAHLLPKNIIYK